MEKLFSMDNLFTPIIQINCENNELFIKRDDLLPFSFGGNKVRIALEFIDDMFSQNKNCIVGYGNARSNLSRALANICNKYLIPCYIISPAEEDGTRIDTFNSKIVKSCEANFIFCEKQNVKATVEEVLQYLKNKGLKPYYIYGDSSGKGNEHIPVKAYKKVYEEIKDKYDYIFLATGTGMTQSGLIVGKIANKGNEKIIGISIARDTITEINVIKNMIQSYNDKIEKLEEFNQEYIYVDDSNLCDGYGNYNFEIENIILKQLTKNGIPLDPTYTGKAFYGMLKYLNKNNIKGKKILFIHTGGTPLFFDYINSLKLVEINDYDLLTAVISKLEQNLVPSLCERNINLIDYSNKLFKYGKIWAHYNFGTPISIIGGYFNDYIEYTAYISILSVNKEYRGKKIGYSLMKKAEDYSRNCGMKKIKLEVRKENIVAQRFYEKLGYRIIGEATNTSFYMSKDLI